MVLYADLLSFMMMKFDLKVFFSMVASVATAFALWACSSSPEPQTEPAPAVAQADSVATPDVEKKAEPAIPASYKDI